jgi:hypothetical protein
VADEAQVKLLKEKGVEAWNAWRVEHFSIRPDLTDVDLHGVDLRGAEFFETNLHGANLAGANLHRANLGMADLNDAYLRSADLEAAFLVGTSLRVANLTGVNLRAAQLQSAELFETRLTGANFEDSVMGFTILADVDLDSVKGLESVKHDGPSTVGIDTIYRSGGNIPEVFMRGAGVPESFIANMKALMAAMSPIEFYSCFISYSSKDQEFAERLYADLQNKGVRCWFAPEDLKIGDKLRPVFDEAIRMHDKLMVLLSENSVSSPWVEKEVETAFEKERQQKRTVLFPIRLDEAVMNTDQAWAADIRRTRHIGDFRDWKNHDSYKKAFGRLLRDLKAEDKVQS